MRESRKHHHIPGWNELVKSHHELAHDAYLLWKTNNKPRTGPIFDLMKRTRSRFKLEFHKCKQNEERIRYEKISESLLNHDFDSFWKNVKKINRKTCVLSSVVDGKSGFKNIVEMWETHFKDIMNSVNNTKHRNSVLESFRDLTFNDEMKVNPHEIETTIKELLPSKSPGLDKLSSEHLKFSSQRILMLLSLLFSAIFAHGTLPNDMIQSVITPVVKDKNGDLTLKNNYHPIAISSIVSKLLEKNHPQQMHGIPRHH